MTSIRNPVEPTIPASEACFVWWPDRPELIVFHTPKGHWEDHHRARYAYHPETGARSLTAGCIEARWPADGPGIAFVLLSLLEEYPALDTQAALREFGKIIEFDVEWTRRLNYRLFLVD